jgi:adenylyltransferase/sulfurtransferase
MDESPEVSVSEVAKKLCSDEAVVLIDVREPHEWNICAIDGAVFLRLRELPHRIEELDRSHQIVTYCHTGVRSLFAQQFLASAGFSNVRSMRGGIHAWAVEIDPTLPRY